MREVNYHNQIDFLVFNIYSYLDVFRSSEEISSTEDLLSVGMLLLSLQKDGLLKQNDLKDRETFDAFCKKIMDNSKLDSIPLTYPKIFSVLEDKIFKLENSLLQQISFKLFGLNVIDKEILTQNFAIVFDKILYQYLKAYKRPFGEFIQPIELTRLMLALPNLKKDATIFNPFAGLASFGISLDSQQVYFGQEIHPKTWVIGALRLLAYGKKDSVNYVCDDSLVNWPKEAEKFDFIVSNPPFRMRIGNLSGIPNSQFKTVEQFIISKGLQSLNQSGKLVTLLPTSFLNSQMYQEHNLRKSLVDQDLIDTIISLPGGILPHTGIPIIVLFLNKKKERPGLVRFIKADSFVESDGSKRKVLNDLKLSALVHQHEKEIFVDSDPNIVSEPAAEYHSSYKKLKKEDIERTVELKELKESNYDIHVPKYFQKPIDFLENEKLVKLGDIIKLIEVKKDNIDTRGKFVQIRDLKNDKVDYILESSRLEESELKRPVAFQVTESCLLLTLRWQTLKPTFFNFKGEKIYRNQDVVSFKVDESRVEIAYLINELHADYVIEQLNSIRISGSVIPFIRKHDLMKVLIKLPSMNEQRAKIAGINEVYTDIRLSESKVKEENQIVFNDVTEQNNFLRHSIAGNLANLRGSFKKLKHIFESQIKLTHPEILDMKENNRSQLTLANLLHSMERDIEKVSLDTQRNTLGDSYIQSAIMESIEIIPFISELVNEIISNPNRNFEITFTPAKNDFVDAEGNEVRVYINGNKNLLKDMFNNIIENAIEHAFESDFRENNLISIDCFGNNMDEPRFIFSISNNGKRLPEDFTQEMFVRKGSKAGPKAGNGYGGWLINQIIHKHNGTLEIDDEQGPQGIGGIWSTSFEINLPVLNYEKYE